MSREESNAKKDVIYTDKKVSESDYIDAQVLYDKAKQLNTSDAWRGFHLWVDDLAVNKYGLPQRTGRYGLTSKGEFTHTVDSVVKGNIITPPPPPPPGGMSDELNENDFSSFDR